MSKRKKLRRLRHMKELERAVLALGKALGLKGRNNLRRHNFVGIKGTRKE